jgi:hypothetical protein
MYSGPAWAQALSEDEVRQVQERVQAEKERQRAEQNRLGALFSGTRPIFRQRNHMFHRRSRPSATKPAIEGRIVSGTMPGTYNFVREDSSPVAIENPDQVSSLAVGPELKVKGSINPDTGRLRIESYELAVPPPSVDLEKLNEPQEQARAAGRDIVGALNTAISPGAQSTTDRALGGSSTSATVTRDRMKRIVAAYKKAVTACAGDASNTCDAAQIEDIVSNWGEIRNNVTAIFSDGTEYKAVYGTIDNFDPWRKARMWDDASAVVALSDADRKNVLCSGVLIAKDLVLTAGHCFSEDVDHGTPGRVPENYEVQFGFVQQPDNGRVGPAEIVQVVTEPVAPPRDRWRDLQAGMFDAKLYDYAVIRIKRPACDPALRPEERPFSCSVTPRCLKKLPPPRGRPVYVLGYPRGERGRVHDNARVYLPFSIPDGDLFWRLRLDVEADLAGLDGRDAKMQDFDASYQLRAPRPGDLIGPVRLLYDVRDGGQPRMGIVADLYEGNSGGPVFDHEGDQCVVGILSRGMPDTGERRGASWVQHERILPITAILDDLQRNPATASLLTDGTLTIRP